MPQEPLRWLLRARLALAEILRPSELQATLLCAGLVGLAGGVASVAFRAGVHGLQWLLMGHGGSLVQTARELPWAVRMVVPCLGGGVAGLILQYGMYLLRGQRSTDYMEAIALGDGQIRTRSTLVKSASSLVTIASGGSIGREGPMVQLAAMLASVAGRWTRLSTPRLRLLVACGAAAGIAAAYNAPIAGALFVAEVILGTIATESFGPLVFSSVISTLTVRQMLGGRPVFEVPAFHLVSHLELPFYLLLGMVCGGAAPWFLKLLKETERSFRQLPWPVWARMTAGGLVVGLISVYVPEVWGNGYSVVDAILHRDLLWPMLVLLLVTKLMATSATVGSGAVGGVFTPTLFVGAILGSLLGQAVHALLPGYSGASSGYALVGMGCFLAATTHAPLMAIMMLFEMTLDYDIVLPLMLGCVTAHYVAQGMKSESIYAESLRRDEARPDLPIERLCVRDLMKSNPVCVPETASFAEVVAVFAQHQHNYLYVTNAEGGLRGAIALHDIKSFLTNESLSDIVIASDLIRDDIPPIGADAPALSALEKFAGYAMERLVVVDLQQHRKVLGTVSKTDLLLTFVHQGPRKDAEEQKGE